MSWYPADGFKVTVYVFPGCGFFAGCFLSASLMNVPNLSKDNKNLLTKNS
jgi:hypothetical protein